MCHESHGSLETFSIHLLPAPSFKQCIGGDSEGGLRSLPFRSGVGRWGGWIRRWERVPLECLPEAGVGQTYSHQYCPQNRTAFVLAVKSPAGACFSCRAHLHGQDTGEGGFETGQRGPGPQQMHIWLCPPAPGPCCSTSP